MPSTHINEDTGEKRSPTLCKAGTALRRRLQHRISEANEAFSLFSPGDSLLIGLSGGKDSLALLELLAERRDRLRGALRLEALHVRMEGVDYSSDTGYLQLFAASLGVPLHIKQGRFEPDRKAQRSPCFLCAWTRRKIFFETAQQLGCNKLALGHHLDDLLHTALMNLTFNGALSTMRPLQVMDRFPLTIVRPLCRIRESDLTRWAALREYQEQTKRCPHEQRSKREAVKQEFARLEQLNAEFPQSLWRALVSASKL